MSGLARRTPASGFFCSPAAAAWGVSALVHACAGVACCLLAVGSPPGAAPREATRPPEAVVAVWLPSERAVERTPFPPKAEESPEAPSFAIAPAPSPSETLELPEPCEVANVPPLPERPTLEEPPAWPLDADPPRIGIRVVFTAPAEPEGEPAAPDGPSAAADEPLVAARRDSASAAGEERRASSAPAACAGNPLPAYPRAARRRGQEGLVVVSARVSAEGACLAVELKQSSGCAELDATAMAAVRGWRFRPAVLDGAPAEAEIEIPIRFRLTD